MLTSEATVPREMGSRPRKEGDRIGIVLIDPLHVVRAGLKLLVSGQSDLEVIGEAATAEAGLELIESLHRRSSTVIVVALELDGVRDAVWLIREIRERFPSLPLVASAGTADGTAISRALFVGSDGFVHKNAEPERFLEALRRIARGEVVLEGLPKDWLGAIGEAQQAPLKPVLTDREREVLSAAADGLTAYQIGSRLGVRERTVTTHLGRIYRKLGVNGRISAIAAAHGAGWVPLRERHSA